MVLASLKLRGQQARALPWDYGSALARAILTDGRSVPGRVMFEYEHWFADSRGQLGGTFWFEWTPELGIGEDFERFQVETPDAELAVRGLGNRTLVMMDSEPRHSYVEFLEARHVRD